jgi:excisionase family DNA binding protein
MTRHSANRAAARPDRRLASTRAAAETFDVGERTVRRWVATGLIHGYRVGQRSVRVDLNEIEAKLVQEIPAAGAGR